MCVTSHEKVMVKKLDLDCMKELIGSIVVSDA